MSNTFSREVEKSFKGLRQSRDREVPDTLSATAQLLMFAPLPAEAGYGTC